MGTLTNKISFGCVSNNRLWFNKQFLVYIGKIKQQDYWFGSVWKWVMLYINCGLMMINQWIFPIFRESVLGHLASLLIYGLNQLKWWFAKKCGAFTKNSGFSDPANHLHILSGQKNIPPTAGSLHGRKWGLHHQQIPFDKFNCQELGFHPWAMDMDV